MCETMKKGESYDPATFKGWTCFQDDPKMAEIQCSAGLFIMVMFLFGALMCHNSSESPWDFSPVAKWDLRRAFLYEGSFLPRSMRNLVAGLTMASFRDFRGLTLLTTFLYVSSTVFFGGESLFCFLAQCALIQSGSDPNVAVLILVSFVNLLIFYLFIVSFLKK